MEDRKSEILRLSLCLGSLKLPFIPSPCPNMPSQLHSSQVYERCGCWKHRFCLLFCSFRNVSAKHILLWKIPCWCWGWLPIPVSWKAHLSNKDPSEHHALSTISGIEKKSSYNIYLWVYFTLPCSFSLFLQFCFLDQSKVNYLNVNSGLRICFGSIQNSWMNYWHNSSEKLPNPDYGMTYL